MDVSEQTKGQGCTTFCLTRMLEWSGEVGDIIGNAEGRPRLQIEILECLSQST